jgi:ribonucleotide reductase alpha subunit
MQQPVLSSLEAQRARAAKMVCLDLDHPEIVDFIEWKMKEEDKVAALNLPVTLLTTKAKLTER